MKRGRPSSLAESEYRVHLGHMLIDLCRRGQCEGPRATLGGAGIKPCAKHVALGDGLMQRFGSGLQYKLS